MQMTSEGPIDRYCESGHIVSPTFYSLRTSYMKYGKSTMQKEVAESRPKLNYLRLFMPMNNRRKFNLGRLYAPSSSSSSSSTRTFINEFFLSCYSNGREHSKLRRPDYISAIHGQLTLSLLKNQQKPTMDRIPCRKLPSLEQMLLLCSDLIAIRETYFIESSLCCLEIIP